MGPWYKGITIALHAINPSSSLGGSTETIMETSSNVPETEKDLSLRPRSYLSNINPTPMQAIGIVACLVCVIAMAILIVVGAVSYIMSYNEIAFRCFVVLAMLTPAWLVTFF